MPDRPTVPPPPSAPEAWLRGPVEGVAPHLQPVAHALLQAAEELARTLAPLSADELWARPGGAASVGYHVRHALGSLDRLLTYAEGRALSPEQLRALAEEAQPAPARAEELLAAARRQLGHAMSRVRGMSDDALLEAREVGRARLPSTVIGLVFHAAEHTTRHVGQAVTTARIVRALGARSAT